MKFHCTLPLKSASRIFLWLGLVDKIAHVNSDQMSSNGAEKPTSTMQSPDDAQSGDPNSKVEQQQEIDPNDPVMAYVQKLEDWRQGKLDKFDSDEAYRDERLMKHGTRTGFEEFLDRSIENQIRKQLSGNTKKKKKKKKQKGNAGGGSGNADEPDTTAGAGATSTATDSETAKHVAGLDTALSAFEKMARALKAGKLGVSSEKQSQPKTEERKKLDADEQEAMWEAVLGRMDEETSKMWKSLESREADCNEIKRRFFMSLETGVSHRHVCQARWLLFVIPGFVSFGLSLCSLLLRCCDRCCRFLRNSEGVAATRH